MIEKTFLWLICCLTVMNTAPPPSSNPIIGYQYNLWGLQAHKIGGNDLLDFTGRIYLDIRKDYKTTYDRDEHWFYSKEKFKDGEVKRFQGYHKTTVQTKHQNTEDYYIALKLGNKSSRFYYDDIISNDDTLVGAEVGCTSCNFSEELYLEQEDWIIRVYFELRPLYTYPIEKTKASDEDTDLLTTMDAMASANENIAPSIVSKRKRIEKTEENYGKATFVSLTTSSANSSDKNINAPIVEVRHSSSLSYHVLFKIMPTPFEEFADLKDIGHLYRETYTPSGKTRYLLGHCLTLDEAKNLATKMNEKGYENLFIAQYQNGSLQKYIERWY